MYVCIYTHIHTPKQPYEHIHTHTQELKLALEKFSPMRIDWELTSIGGRSDDQVIVMQPGYEYVLEALIQIRPIYSKDVWEFGKIERWERQVVSTSASRSALTDSKKLHQVVVRYHLRFDPLVQSQTFNTDYTVLVFMHTLGAAAGYLVLGGILLSCILRVRILVAGGVARRRRAAVMYNSGAEAKNPVNVPDAMVEYSGE